MILVNLSTGFGVYRVVWSHTVMLIIYYMDFFFWEIHRKFTCHLWLSQLL